MVFLNKLLMTINIISNRKLYLGIAGVVVASAIAIIAVFGLKFGIDFTGGSLTEVSYGVAPEKDSLETVVTDLGLVGSSVRASVDESGRDAYLIRTRDLSEGERVNLTQAVTELGSDGEVSRFTSIGPVIGQELRDKAVWAIGAVLLVIILYVAYAFAGIGTPVRSWTYGGITILVLMHDILVPTAVMAILGMLVGAEVDVLFVMALLAVLGYSVNDTIVIFDRVREQLVANRTEHKIQKEEVGVMMEEVTYTLNKPYAELVQTAVNESMARSINTSITTMVSLVALYFIGGDVTQTFALVLLAGVIAGTYSSICIASPLVVAYAKWRGVDVDSVQTIKTI
jgi:preprotein translocase subunit SecF